MPDNGQKLLSYMYIYRACSAHGNIHILESQLTEVGFLRYALFPYNDKAASRRTGALDS